MHLFLQGSIDYEIRNRIRSQISLFCQIKSPLERRLTESPCRLVFICCISKMMVINVAIYLKFVLVRVEDINRHICSMQVSI